MELKDYPELFSAFLTPIIAIVAAYIAIQQYRVNQRKSKLELFEKRFAVYEGVKDLVDHVIDNVDLTDPALQAFNSKTADCVFLFKDHIPSYVKELRGKALRLRSINRMGSSHEAREEEGEVEEELLNWFTEQFERAQREFGPYLRFRD